MATNTTTQQFHDLVNNIDTNIKIQTKVTVNGTAKTIMLVYKNNLHTTSCDILKVSDIDHEHEVIKLINDIKYRHLN